MKPHKTPPKEGLLAVVWHALFAFFISSRNRELIAVVLASVVAALVICQPMIVVIIRHWIKQ